MSAAGNGLFWRLPGPRRFIEDVASAVEAPEGIASLRLPLAPPPGLIDAVARALREHLGLRVLLAEASGGTGPRGPVHWLAARAAAGATGIRTAIDFLDDPSLTDTVFLVHGAPRADWRHWANLLRLLRSERGRRERIAGPAILFVPHPAIPPLEMRAVFGRQEIRWLGRVGRLDTEVMAERALGSRADDTDLVGRAVAACCAEVAGWDQLLLTFLAGLPPEEALSPLEAMEAQAALLADQAPTWDNGLVDEWDGMPFEHSLSLLRRGRRRDVERRIWRAQVKAIFPFLDRVRLAVARHHRGQLLADGPWRWTDRKGTEHVVADPDDFELNVIHHRLKRHVDPADGSFLYLCHSTRNRLAHMNPVPAGSILALSQHWEANGQRFREESHGWDWPRCGQRLVVLVGQPGRARTEWARSAFAASDILSLDSAADGLGRDEASRRLRDEAATRLAQGRSVVVDGSHDDPAQHLACALAAPAGIRVDYADRLGAVTPFDGQAPPVRNEADPGLAAAAAE